MTADDPAKRYLRLALRMARHDETVIDSYFGPAHLAAAVDAESLTAPADLVTDAEELLADLADGWLRDQVAGLRTFAGILAGGRLSYPDEVEAC